jgi:hypothetical protein
MFKPIMSPSAEGDNNGGTTNAENGSQGAQPSNDEQNLKAGEKPPETPQFATVEQLNRALTSYNKRLEGHLEKKLTETLNPLMEMLQSLKPTEGAEAGKQADNSEKPNKEVLKLQNQMQELQAMLERERKEKTEATQRALESRLKSEVLRVLSELKVDKTEQVYRLVRDELIVDEATGRISMKVVDPKLGFEEEKDLKAGITDWLNNDGAHFLPPKQVSGSGAGTGNNTTVAVNKIFNIDEFMKMKPSEAAQVDLRKALGSEVVDAFFGKK